MNSREKIMEMVKDGTLSVEAVSYTHLDVYKRQSRSPGRSEDAEL